MLRKTVSKVLPKKARDVLWYARSRQLRLAMGAAKQIKAKCGCVVLSGPFAGMKYVETSFGSTYPPKLLGTYEMELRGVIAEIAGRGYGKIVDIGAAEGYYTVGLARMFPGVEVVGYETQTAAHVVMAEMAVMNGVGERVRVKGFCTATALAVDLRGKEKHLLVSDCEGWEQTLLSPEAIAGLARTDVLVETHDFVMPGVSRTMRGRFRETHDIEVIKVAKRRLEDWPAEAEFVGKKHRLAAMAEHRPEEQVWLWMKARER